MSETDGIIKYRLEFAGAEPVDPEWTRSLNRWRTVLIEHGLLGQDPARYDGYGFGNVSRRMPPWDAPPFERRFLITGSQTGHLTTLEPGDFALVLACFPEENRLVAEGLTRPSSESLTHGSLYALDPTIRAVMHVHDSKIWSEAGRFGIPITDPSVPYGSPELAREIAGLYSTTRLPLKRVLAMGGHEDGLVAFGTSLDEAGEHLLDLVIRARS